jgi:hypothetical protein
MKTAVEWLYEQMPKKIQPHYKRQLNQAKEMEKEQIGDAWDSAYGGDSYYSGESYYNGTFKQQEQCKCGQPKVGGYSCQRTDCNQTFKQQEQ